MSDIVLEAEARNDIGRGASRRLRRLENKIPAIIYGGSKKPQNLHLAHNKVMKTLENEAIYSSVLTLHIDNKKERVILKDLQRHPYKPVILHMDFQRVSDKDVLVKHIPLHFINEDQAPGIKDGGIISHTMTQVEVRCQVKYLPEFIEVDMSQLGLNEVIHLADLKLGEHVTLTVDAQDHSHNLPVVSIHLPRVVVEEEPVVEEELSEGETAEDAEASAHEGEHQDTASTGDQPAEEQP